MLDTALRMMQNGPVQVLLVDPSSASLTAYPSVHHGGRLCVAVPEGAKLGVLSKLASDEFKGARAEYVVAVDGRDSMTNADASVKLPGIITGPTYLCKGFRVSADGVHEFVCTTLGKGATTTERNGTASRAGLVAVVAYAERRRSPLRAAASSAVDAFLRAGGPIKGGHRGDRPISRDRIRLGDNGGGDGVIPAVVLGDTPTATGVVWLCAAGSNAASCSTATADVVGDTSASARVLRSVASAATAGVAAGAFVEDRTTETEWQRGAKIAEVVVEYDTPEGWAVRGVSFDVVPMTRSPWVADAPQFADPQSL